MADRDERTALVAPRRSIIGVVREHPFVFAVAALLGALAVGAAVYLAQSFMADEEAPIRVRNGSLELHLLTASQEWKQVGSSGNYRVAGGTRFKEEFEITVAVKAGAACGGTLATGSEIVFTYDNDKEVRLSSTGRNTSVKPGEGVTLTWDVNTPQKLTYAVAGGYIKRITVQTGGTTASMCSFTAANQLDHIIILNVP